METATIPAWWGSITGSVALVWQIYRWFRSGPRLKISAGTNMQIIVPEPGVDKTLYVSLNVRNVGDQATTITHFCGQVFPGQWSRLLRRNARFFIVTTDKVPCKHGAGETWSVLALQDPHTKFPGGSAVLLGV